MRVILPEKEAGLDIPKTTKICGLLTLSVVSVTDLISLAKRQNALFNQWVDAKETGHLGYCW
jgi:hypothetical protein